MKVLLLAIAILSTTKAYAEAPDFVAPVTLGRYAVGFVEWQEKELTVSVWYPAERGSTRMLFGDYLGARRAGFKDFLSSAGLPADTVESFLNAKMAAVRAAPPIRRRFPLVLVAQGNEHTAADQAVLCEYLASHGYLVATTPSPMIATPIDDVHEIGAFAERQAAQLGRAVDIVAQRFRVDRRRIAVVGHSFGARAGLLLAMRDHSIRALVSLDGGIGSALGVESMKSSPSFRVGRVPPILHMYEREDAFMQTDLTFLQRVGAEALHTERIDGLHHAHFSTIGFAAAALPAVRTLTRAGDDVATKMAYVAERTRRFLAVYLRAA